MPVSYLGTLPLEDAGGSTLTTSVGFGRKAVIWVTRTEAAEILRVSGTRVSQLADTDLIPCVVLPTPRSVRRMYRRDQLEVVANAPDTRWSGWH
jgi:hypothetical protein